MGKRVGRRYRRVHKQKAQREQERNLAHGANETKLKETDVIHLALLGRGESCQNRFASSQLLVASAEDGERPCTD